MAEFEGENGRESIVEYYAVVTPPPQGKGNEAVNGTMRRSQYTSFTPVGMKVQDSTPQRTSRTVIDSLPLTVRDSSLQPHLNNNYSHSGRQNMVSPFIRESKVIEVARGQHQSMPKNKTRPSITTRLTNHPEHNIQSQVTVPRPKEGVKQGLTVHPMKLLNKP